MGADGSTTGRSPSPACSEELSFLSDISLSSHSIKEMNLSRLMGGAPVGTNKQGSSGYWETAVGELPTTIAWDVVVGGPKSVDNPMPSLPSESNCPQYPVAETNINNQSPKPKKHKKRKKNKKRKKPKKPKESVKRKKGKASGWNVFRTQISLQFRHGKSFNSPADFFEYYKSRHGVLPKRRHRKGVNNVGGRITFQRVASKMYEELSEEDKASYSVFANLFWKKLGRH